MKKISLIMGIGAIALASCSSDELVDKGANGSLQSETPIGFSISTPNMGRSSNLETVRYDFGVYAYKGETEAAFKNIEADNTVMSNYLVGYYDEVNQWGYKPLANQLDNTDGSNWFYEGLGNGTDDASKFEFKEGGVQNTASISQNPRQYLKYWDMSKTYTYFFACAPYDIASFAGSAAGAKLTFPQINESTPGFDNYMYASKRMVNASHADVDLKFQRLASQIRVAFYEDITGYEVSLINFSTEKAGVRMIPADCNAGSYTVGKYLAKATPTVTFTENGALADGIAAVVNYDIPSDGWSNNTIVYGIDTFKDKTNAPSVILGDGTTTEGVRDLLMGPTRTVIPSDATTINSGFTLVVNFQLRALDTNEILNVYGAKVYVENTTLNPNFVWEPNHLYTYIFKITKDVKGSTDPEDPDPDDPTPPVNPALYPIIFDNVTIDDFNEVVVGEWTISE